MGDESLSGADYKRATYKVQLLTFAGMLAAAVGGVLAGISKENSPLFCAGLGLVGVAFLLLASAYFVQPEPSASPRPASRSLT